MQPTLRLLPEHRMRHIATLSADPSCAAACARSSAVGVDPRWRDDGSSAVNERDHSEYLAEADRLVAGATARIATIRARIDDFKRNGLHTSAAQEILETLEGTLQELQEQRDIIAHLVEMGARQDR
jgi:hypothetical protein